MNNKMLCLPPGKIENCIDDETSCIHYLTSFNEQARDAFQILEMHSDSAFFDLKEDLKEQAEIAMKELQEIAKLFKK